MAGSRGQDCEPLTMSAANGTAFAFLGVPELLKRSIAPETALQPAHAAGAAGMYMTSRAAVHVIPHRSAAAQPNHSTLCFLAIVVVSQLGPVESAIQLITCDIKDAETDETWTWSGMT